MKNFKSIAQRNTEFASMTKMEKRVALAKDVLAQLEMKKFVSTPGTYVDSHAGYEPDPAAFGGFNYDKPIIAETCNVCALGALTVSLIDGDAFNSTGRGKVNCYDVLTEAGLWSYNEVELIECAFENAHYLTPEGYWDRSPEPEFRMKEIMMNIVRNKGEFKGEQLPFKY